MPAANLEIPSYSEFPEKAELLKIIVVSKMIKMNTLNQIGSNWNNLYMLFILNVKFRNVSDFIYSYSASGMLWVT